VLPSSSPPTDVACDVPPVLEKVFFIRVYATPAVVEYRHVAASSVFKERVVEVVRAGRVPVGEPSVRPGGVVSLPLLPASVTSGETARMAASSTKPATATAAAIRSPRHFTVFMGAASLARYRLSVSTLFRISPETRPTARDLRECLGTPSAAKSAHAEPCRASAQSRLIVVATSARLPSGSASVHQAGLVPFDEARHLPKAFTGLAGSVRLTTGYGSADDSAEEPLPFIPGTRKDFDPGVDEELHRD